MSPLRIVVPTEAPGVECEFFEGSRQIKSGDAFPYIGLSRISLVVEAAELNRVTLETAGLIGEIECDACFSDEKDGEIFRVSLTTDLSATNTAIKRLDGIELPALTRADFELFPDLKGPPLILHRLKDQEK